MPCGDLSPALLHAWNPVQSQKAREETALLQNPTGGTGGPHGEDCGDAWTRAVAVVVIHSPLRSVLSLCSVHWPVLPEPFPRLLLGKLVCEDYLVQNGVRCLDELRCGCMPQRLLELCTAELHVCVRSSPPLMTERTISWEESTPIVSSPQGSRHLPCAVLILEFLRHGLWSMGVYFLWMVTCYFRPLEPLTILTGDIQIPSPRASFPRGPTTTYAANDTAELYSLVRELARDSLRQWKPHGTCIQLQLAGLLGGVEQNDRGGKVGEFHPTLGAVHGTTQRPFHRRNNAWARPRKSFRRLPAICQAYALRYENVLHKVISGSAPIAGLQLPPVRGICSCPSARVALVSWCCQMQVAKLVAGFDSVVSLLVSTISRSSPRIFAGSVPMLGLALCSAQCFAHPLLLGQIVVPQKRIQDGQMFGVRNLSRRTFGQANQQFKRVTTGIRDLQKLLISWILIHPLSSHVWRTSPVCLLEQHHRSHSITFDQFAFGTPWELRSKSIDGRCDYHDILSLAECFCEEHHVCAYSRRPHIQLHGSDLNGRQFTARCKVLPPHLCSKLCNIFISRENGNG